ncbi:MAG: ammonia channel protein, partial [Candidatus Humimicrobiaceae bacterium]
VESLDVWAVHGIGGIWGAIATGIFATVAVNPLGADGLISGNLILIGKQFLSIIAVCAYSFGMTWLIGKLIDKIIGLRVSAAEETIGLDISQHGESAYGEIRN